MAYRNISEYGIIGNGCSAALISNDGSIDWCCLPRFDSPSVFAAILDDVKGGRFHIKPSIPFTTNQTYIKNTNVLQTTFQTNTGKATVTDFMPCYLDSRQRAIQFLEIHRLIDCSNGEVSLEAFFKPRLDYARGATSLTLYKTGVLIGGESVMLSLSSSVPFTIEDNSAISIFTLKKGQQVRLILRYGQSRHLSPDTYKSTSKLNKTVEYWQHQANVHTISGRWSDAIVRSYLLLHLMIYTPTGAIIAAPTTSLPEEIGGERNWDYRFSWLRDASLTITAFARLGHTEEVLPFMKWLMTICTKYGSKAQILHDINFEDPINEQELNHLSGYRNSRPVRIGNAAYRQIQLDVYGELVLAAYSFFKLGIYFSRKTWAVMEVLINGACDSWQLPDNGIWEVRSGPYHFVHSKLMCWAAVNTGIKMAEELGYDNNLSKWRKAAQDIRNDILAKGWNAERHTFTQHYDTNALDASNLLIPLYNFLPISDERIKSTIEITRKELGWQGLLRRYKTEETDDGIGGSEGIFLWCSFWLVRNLIRMDRLEEAIDLYERLLGYSNHLGLLSEMVNPETGEALGNFPQALTHLAVIITGLELTTAAEGKDFTTNNSNK
jgi:GH15 family glucan-1,4-alpha-glucosidase